MKSYSMMCFFLSLAMILCPLISVEKANDSISQEFLGETFVNSELNSNPSYKDATVKIMSADSKNITEISLREYLIGVAFVEVGPYYHEEAIKAQIVASHTMLEYTKSHKTEDLLGADITDDSSTHQGYMDIEEQKQKFGENYSVYREKIEKCVDEVIPYIIYYDNEPIIATYFAISNGNTENAKDVWGGDVPYLISVSSEQDKNATNFTSTKTFTTENFEETIIQNGGKGIEIGEIKRTDTGMVKTIVIGGKAFKGTEIRKLFSLKSSTFEISEENGKITFTVKGYGHGVGMSQHGANCLAKEGKTYKEILAHYYPNTVIK